MGKNRGIQLDLSKRKIIAISIKAKKTLKEIALLLGYHSSTISREILRNRFVTKDEEEPESICDTCIKKTECYLHHRCGRITCNQRCLDCKNLKYCESKELIKCKNAKKFPFICDDCKNRRICILKHYTYDPVSANEKAIAVLHNSRKGLDMSEDEFELLNKAVSKGFENIKSIYHVVKAYPNEIPRCPKTIYNYINKNLLDVKRIDLPRAVTYKKRKKIPKEYEYNENKNIDRSHRMLSDWIVFQAKNRVILYWEMDFLGAPHKSEQQILALTLVQFKFTLFFALTKPNNQSVVEVFDYLEEKLGDDFSKVFEAILTDRDCKFNDFMNIEVNKDGVVRTHMFFCNPGRSNEKPHIENFNGQVRISFEKGALLKDITLEQCKIINSNYNSRFLNSIDGKRPVDLFVEYFGIGILKKLGLEIVEPKEVKIKNYKKY